MRIEKINSSQVRVMINSQDLKEYQLSSIRDMKYGSKETAELFRSMIQRAVTQYSFNQDGLPIMIEAVPLGPEDLMLIISAVEDAEELDPHFASFVPPSPALPGFSEEQGSAADGSDKGFVPHVVVLSFPDIDSVMEFSWSIGDGFAGRTALYRRQKSDSFYLVMEKPAAMEKEQFMHFLNGLSEYADIVPGSSALYGYLTEHETPVMEDAVRKFAGY